MRPTRVPGLRGEQPSETLHRVVTHVPPRLATLRDDVPEALEAALAGVGARVTMLFPEAGIGARLFPGALSVFVTGYYRERGVHVATVEEPARHSPFIEEIVVHGKGEFDLETEVDLFAAQLSAQLRAARQLGISRSTLYRILDNQAILRS